jgi:hypothetical protein
MSDIFSLFDGKMGAGSAASISAQSADSFSDVSTENDLIARLASGSDMASLAVDYSDFANFVTFNSAESYVNVTADQILNDYPYDGSVDDLQAFIDSLDGYQRYFLGRWPSRIGHLRFNPSVSASYVKIDDLGAQDGVSRTSFVSPGTGSLSIQGWIDVPLNTSNAIVVFQKEKNSENKISVFAQGSTLSFQVISGSTLWTVTASLSEMPTFFSAAIDRSSTTGSVSLYTATTGTFPVLRNTTEMLSSTRFDLASGSFYIGSGSLTTTTTEAFTGSVDDISVWNVPRGLTELTSSFNRKVYGQSGLVGLWRFNEASDATPRSYAAVVRDNAGHRLDGRIQEYYPALRGSGSLSNDTPDPILSLEDEDVIDYIVDAQSSGTIYDRGNGSMIFNLFPEAFSQNSETFQNFTLIMARFFDRIKLYINQLPNLHRVGYSDYDNAPDDLLDDVGALYGWKLDGNFATADALKYFVGRDVSGGTQGNISIDTKLVDIKSRFWRRVLQNLMYVYKTKGTRESVEALLRIYGVNNNFVKLKEYARKAEARIPVSRAVSEKSVYSLAFGLSGSSGSISASGFSVGSSGDFSAELRVKFPGPTSDEIPPTQLSGELVTFFSSSLAVVQPESVLRLFYEKSSVASLTGNIFLTSSSGRITHSSASIFDGNFYNISVVRETATGSITLATMRYESDIEMHSSSTFSFSGYPSTSFNGVKIGSYSGTLPEFYGQEFRAWDDSLEAIELLDHAKNFESYGRSKSINNEDLKVHWRLNDGVASTSESVSQPIPEIIAYTLGEGGAGGIGANSGSAGGTSTLILLGVSLTASGGGGGTYDSGVASAGGTASGGTTNVTGGAGLGRSGDTGGGGGGGINLSAAVVAAFPQEGSVGADGLTFAGLAAALSGSGYAMGAGGAGGSSSSPLDSRPGSSGSGIGAGGGGAGYFGGAGGAGSLGGGGGGASGGSIPHNGGVGGAGVLVVSFDGVTTILTSGSSIEVPTATATVETWLIGGGGGGAGVEGFDGRAGGGGGAGGATYRSWSPTVAAPSASGTFSVYDSTENANDGLAINFTTGVNSFIKSLLSQAVIPSIDSGWNQEKVRVYDGSNVPVRDRYEDERFLSLEFNMYDALNEDISHLIASYDELNNILGHPMNRYRADYEGLQQMRETYFKRLQGQLNFKEFVNMLDFFDSSFVTIVQRLIPARSIFKGDELVVESHMLERPKYQYGFRPIREGILEISGSISLVDRNEDWP